MDEWESGVKEIWKPEYDYITQEVERLFEEEKIRFSADEKLKKAQVKKNLQLTRIYLPAETYRHLMKFKPFKEFKNLGGIPVVGIDEEKVRIDVEIVNPRKRKRSTVIYVRGT